MDEPSSTPPRPSAVEPSEHVTEPLDWFRQWPEHSGARSLDADPVRTVWHLPRFRLGRRRFTGRIDHALVCVTRSGRYDTYLPPHRPTSVRNYVALYEVDTDPHNFRLQIPLPSSVDSFDFEATADISWRVVDPKAFVISQERDVPGLITRTLLPLLRSASREHDIEDSAEAERSVQQAAELGPAIGTTTGLRADCALRLRRDSAERSHQSRLRTARHEAEALLPEHEAARLRERYESQRQAERIRFYEEHLAKGGVAALALHLAAHPDDTLQVLGRLSDDQAKLVQDQLHLIDRVMDSNRLEDYQLHDPHQLVAERMSALLRTRAWSEQAVTRPELTKPAEAQDRPGTGT